MERSTKQQIERDEQIYQLTTLVAGDVSLQEVLDKLAEAAVKITGVKACSIRLLDEDAGDLKMRSTYGLSEEYRNKGVVSKNDPVVKAAFAGEAVVLDDMRIDGRVKYKEATIREGLVSQLTVVMQFKGEAIGVLRLYSPKPKHFDHDDVGIARAVASQCAVAITNAKLYSEAIEGARIAEQMRLAGIVQRRMIPEKAPLVPGLDLAAAYIPCYDIGGDLYNFHQIGDDCIIVAIADVIGKGIPAALMMSSFRGAVQAYADTETSKNVAPEDIINKINKLACGECRDGEFITFFFAVICVGEMTVSYCNCGHQPTMLIREGQVMELQKGGLVLGVDPQAEYEIETVGLKDGDYLLFYTDGLVDAANFDGEFWGKERLFETAKMFTEGSAEQMVKSILGYRRRFVGLASQRDDTSIIGVKVGKPVKP
ncbi:MAG: SpoIIE family protein phosphatase [Phycisphaerae bacterium]|nr:SpoIIE family protein phosphatase [Phycisphaerae bacterium]NIP56016.1 SpoIIE family protein phosphatase [Phycisphaerae bacterium]NIS54580.1 SpoIIE family protein phosphatase [Phycisphaerae bacterium]NIU10563.1 SpoIIE family protein phosphatase [Phycisphaerae bacterium]NIU60024.1 SpoIIE family protein phosphatase [Phycisphaerae bacterium]